MTDDRSFFAAKPSVRPTGHAAASILFRSCWSTGEFHDDPIKPHHATHRGSSKVTGLYVQRLCCPSSFTALATHTVLLSLLQLVIAIIVKNQQKQKQQWYVHCSIQMYRVRGNCSYVAGLGCGWLTSSASIRKDLSSRATKQQPLLFISRVHAPLLSCQVFRSEGRVTLTLF